MSSSIGLDPAARSRERIDSVFECAQLTEFRLGGWRFRVATVVIGDALLAGACINRNRRGWRVSHVSLAEWGISDQRVGEGKEINSDGSSVE
jgi:hypothetical protein